MPKFFIRANSFAAPFVSDESFSWHEGEDAASALEAFAAEYRHPCGLYAALAYEDANAFHLGAGPLAMWLCNHEREKMRATEGLPSYSYTGNAPGDFEINEVRYVVENPKAGAVVQGESPKKGA